MAVVYSKVLLFDPPLIYTAPDICVFGAVKDDNMEHPCLCYLNDSLHVVSNYTTNIGLSS